MLLAVSVSDGEEDEKEGVHAWLRLFLEPPENLRDDLDCFGLLAQLLLLWLGLLLLLLSSDCVGQSGMMLVLLISFWSLLLLLLLLVPLLSLLLPQHPFVGAHHAWRLVDPFLEHWLLKLRAMMA